MCFCLYSCKIAPKKHLDRKAIDYWRHPLAIKPYSDGLELINPYLREIEANEESYDQYIRDPWSHLSFHNRCYVALSKPVS